MHLNPSQQNVVNSHDKRLLVLAGAGTGKTATSVHWVAARIKAGAAARSQVLMITFTRKAANEMASRVERLIAGVPKQWEKEQLMVGTYHAVASQLLREDPEPFGLRNRYFTTLDESQGKSVWKSALRQAQVEPDDFLHNPAKLSALYSLARNKRQDLHAVYEEVFGEGAAEAVSMAKMYEKLKKAANAVDYDDLLVLWADRLAADEAYAAKLRNRWRYVLVDEMQDNNQLNSAIIEGLSPENLLVVGDANQSIYGFRGSDVTLINDFPKRHLGARVLKLESNYRSGQKILDLANRIVAGTDSALRLQSAKTDTPSDIKFLACPTSDDEAACVVQWIKTKKNRHNYAVLSRGSRSLYAVESKLMAEGIRYKKYGGMSFARAAEIQDFLSFLVVSLNHADGVSSLRVLTQFPGVGEKKAAKLVEEEADTGAHQFDLFARSREPFSAWPRQAQEVMQKLTSERGMAAKVKYLQNAIEPLIKANYPKDYDQRMNRIGTMSDDIGNLEEQAFLDKYSLGGEPNDNHPEDYAVLSTVHSAKGLEWDGVWVMGAGNLQVPHPRTRDDSAQIAEERRLFYVAVTRARQNLIISYPTILETPDKFSASGAEDDEEATTEAGEEKKKKVAPERPPGKEQLPTPFLEADTPWRMAVPPPPGAIAGGRPVGRFGPGPVGAGAGTGTSGNSAWGKRRDGDGTAQHGAGSGGANRVRGGDKKFQGKNFKSPGQRGLF
ncbi:MAG TPA: ATP-dependent helicase [Candidatus Methylacidiphilales bacterium]|nr:ATP-dependent helicase [Candidatus Methylacidiphilales bacterium]